MSNYFDLINNQETDPEKWWDVLRQGGNQQDLIDALNHEETYTENVADLLLSLTSQLLRLTVDANQLQAWLEIAPEFEDWPAAKSYLKQMQVTAALNKLGAVDWSEVHSE